MKNFLIFLFSMTLSFSALTKEVFLTSITNEQDEKFFHYVVTTDKNNAIKNFKKKQYNSKEDYKKGKNPYVTTFPVPEDNSTEMILEKRLGNAVIIIETDDFDPNRGATLKIKYAYNGPQIYFSYRKESKDLGYRSKTIKLEEKDGRWVLIDSVDNRIFTKMHFSIRQEKFLKIWPKGIKDITFSGKK